MSYPVLGNSIFSNAGLGITLQSTVPLANDLGDPDTGANNFQNYPVLSTVAVNGGNVLISGSLNSNANTTYRLEFFANPVCDVSGNGEGKTFLGFTTVTTDGSGNASFNNIRFPAAGGTVITATATVNPSASVFTDTSEFSACLSAPIAVPPPTIAKAFGAPTINAGSSTSLTFTITNQAQGSGALTGVAFTDTLPDGLVVTNPNNLTGTCGGGTITAVAGTDTISLAGASLAANASCSFSVNVTGTKSGVKNNSVSVTSTEGGAGNTAQASVTVALLPPVITKNFQAPTIQAGALSQVNLHFTINNPNPQDAFNPLTNGLTGIAFTDTLPGGLVVFTPNGLGGSCSGVTATAGSTSISMTGGAVGASLTCTIDVTIGAPAGTLPGSSTTSQAPSRRPRRARATRLRPTSPWWVRASRRPSSPSSSARAALRSAPPRR